MKNGFKNSVQVQGYIFSHTLSNRVSRAGVPYISGDIQVATDEAGTNVVPVRFSYVTETRKSGKSNLSYPILQDIIENGKTFEEVGASATKVRISGNVEVNDFYTRTGELASPKRVGGSFIHILNGEIADNPATFNVDMLISSAAIREVEDSQDYVELKGYVFNYRNDILPISLSIRSQAGMDYFLDQDISSRNPLLTELRGEIISTVIKTETEIPGAFGEPVVQTSSRSIRSWDVTWASIEPMEFDDESTITKEELKAALTKREEDLVALKERQDDYRANQGGQSFTEPSTPTVQEDDPDNFEF